MPNWCENTLKIVGKKKEIKEFGKKAKSKDSDLDFENFVPTPKELLDQQSPFSGSKDLSRELKRKYGADDWYEWQCKNWGIKWGVEAELINDNRTKLAYRFLSPWAPPTEFIRKVSILYPSLTFTLKYDEPGMCFKGTTKISQGKTDDRCVNYGG